MIEIYVDGGSRGNPGYAGGGFVIIEDGKVTIEGSEYYGEKTNNQAEYMALGDALKTALEKLGPDTDIHVYMDSMLAVEQMNGNWKIKSENVRPLNQEARRLADQFKSFSISHVRREKNKLADKLANDAMDRGY